MIDDTIELRRIAGALLDLAQAAGTPSERRECIRAAIAYHTRALLFEQLEPRPKADAPTS